MFSLRRRALSRTAGPGEVPGSSAGSGGWADTAAVAFLALAVRVCVVGWAAPRFGPVADGSFYHRLAARIAAGEGYSWPWADGSAHAAAHYPVGYPGMLGGLYAAFGAQPLVAMLFNALMGVVTVVAAHRLLVPFDRASRDLRTGSMRRAPRFARLGAVLVACHPGLVAYTPAIMTEGLSAALVIVALLVAVRARRARSSARRCAWLGALGALGGLGALVRPESALALPLFAAWGAGPVPVGWLRRLGAAAVASLVALATVAPWVARNCATMGRCALALNGGANLLIGTDRAAHGKYAPLVVPPACEGLGDEAAQDGCLAEAAGQRIAADPLGWLALVPAKLGGTFDVCNAGGWYLNASNPGAFGAGARLALGAFELAFERLMVVAALVGSWPRARRVRSRFGRHALRAVLALGLVAACTPFAWLAVAALAGALALRRPGLLHSQGAAFGWFAIVLALAAVHAVFFGEGRYGLVALPLTTVLAVFGIRRVAAFWRARRLGTTQRFTAKTPRSPRSPR